MSYEHGLLNYLLQPVAQWSRPLPLPTTGFPLSRGDDVRGPLCARRARSRSSLDGLVITSLLRGPGGNAGPRRVPQLFQDLEYMVLDSTLGNTLFRSSTRRNVNTGLARLIWMMLQVIAVEFLVGLPGLERVVHVMASLFIGDVLRNVEALV